MWYKDNNKKKYSNLQKFSTSYQQMNKYTKIQYLLLLLVWSMELMLQ